MKNDVIAEFKMPVGLRVESQAVLEFNKYHTDQETFPLEEEVPPSKFGYDMKDLHHRLRATHVADVVVQVLEDGTLKIKEQQ